MHTRAAGSDSDAASAAATTPPPLPSGGQRAEASVRAARRVRPTADGQSRLAATLLRSTAGRIGLVAINAEGASDPIKTRLALHCQVRSGGFR